MTRAFDFRTLSQNRRVVEDGARKAELDKFHKALTSISEGTPDEVVRQFFVDCFVRGARVSAENVDFEGSTAVFTKRRYRDRWNRTLTRRVAKKHNHTIKIKAKVRAQGARSQQWYSDQRANALRKRARTQMLWNLLLAGDWHHNFETLPQCVRPHLMRVMLVSNLATDQRFANGTQGRLLHWAPEHCLRTVQSCWRGSAKSRR